MKLVVGLGNPGAQYALTRHNLGFMVVDALHAAHGLSGWQSKFSGLTATAEVNGQRLLLLKPQTYMNLSGPSVQAAVAFHKLKLENVWVVHDELDIPFGQYKTKQGGGDAGHNGLKSITGVLGPNYHRLRCGIGRPERKEMVESYVLQPFGAQEGELPQVLKTLTTQLITLVAE